MMTFFFEYAAKILLPYHSTVIYTWSPAWSVGLSLDVSNKLRCPCTEINKQGCALPNKSKVMETFSY